MTFATPRLPSPAQRYQTFVPVLAATLIFGLLGAVVALGPNLAIVATLAALGGGWLLWSLPALRLKEMLRLEWWQLLWLLLYASGFVLRERTTGSAAENPLDPAAFYRVGMVGLAALALQFFVIARRIDIISPLFRGLFLLLTLFNVFNILSYAWSINPGWTLYRSLEHTIDVLVVIAFSTVLVSARDYKRLVDWTWLLLGLALLSVFMGALIWPNQALDRGLGVIGFGIEGVLPRISRNGVGALGATIAIVAVARLATREDNRRLYWGLLLVGIGVVLLSLTRSIVAPLFVSIPLVLLAARRIGVGFCLPLAGVAAMMFTGLGGLFTQFWQRHETAGQIANLNGRLDYWEYAWQLVLEKPLTGLGAFAGGRFEVAQHVGHDTLSSTHGTYPEVLVGTGFPGLILVVLLLIGVWWYIGRRVLSGPGSTSEDRLSWALAVEALGVLAVISGRSIFDVALVWHPALPFLAIVAYAQFLRSHPKSAPEAAPVPRQRRFETVQGLKRQ